MVALSQQLSDNLCLLSLEVCNNNIQQLKSVNIQSNNTTFNKAVNRNNVNSVEKNNITKLPSFCLLNSRSLLHKVDELAIRLNTSPFGFVAIEDHLLAIQEYNIYRRDRALGRGGGVCAFVADGIPTKHRPDLEHASFETLWLWLRPHCLPRPLSSLICCVLYNPPGATSQQQKDLVVYLIETLDVVRNRSPDCGVVILGDFNGLDVAEVLTHHNLKQVVQVPTRENKILDLYFDKLIRLLHESFYNRTSQ